MLGCSVGVRDVGRMGLIQFNAYRLGDRAWRGRAGERQWVLGCVVRLGVASVQRAGGPVCRTGTGN